MVAPEGIEPSRTFVPPVLSRRWFPFTAWGRGVLGGIRTRTISSTSTKRLYQFAHEDVVRSAGIEPAKSSVAETDGFTRIAHERVVPPLGLEPRRLTTDVSETPLVTSYSKEAD